MIAQKFGKDEIIRKYQEAEKELKNLK